MSLYKELLDEIRLIKGDPECYNAQVNMIEASQSEKRGKRKPANLYKEIEKAFPKLEKLFTKEELLRFSKMPKKHLENYAYGMGMTIRLKLLRNNMLYKCFVQHGFTDKDEIALKIIQHFHSSLQDD